ncbi:MarR family winged helix-turn-helix transcriptional regulator [Streptomyces sp. NPDC048419]|uniref:MarR family winged helix-turn-helix transcriptional regulator n=1 Tax=Streptomyces sp. NPDC048419 TaxID=3365547 RepID=UPI00371A377A
MTTDASTTAPAADARALGLAHYAARAVLEHVLARHGATFAQQITLRLVAVAEAPFERAALVDQVAGSLKTDTASVQGVVEQLLAKGLLASEASQVRITDAGREFYAAVSGESAEISARVWGGIPAEDLATTGRVLALVTERANAELAALSS